MNTKPLQWRAAIKEYNVTKKLTEDQVSYLREVLRMAPSSYGLQPYMFVQVDDENLRKKLREAAYDQSQVTDASHLFVLASKLDPSEEDIDEYLELISKTRGIPKESLSDFAAMMKGSYQSSTPEQLRAWAAHQVYITLGFLLAEAAEHDIDATPMEGFDKGKVDELLELESKGYTAKLLVPVGFRSEDDGYSKMKKVRKEAEEIFEIR